MADSSGLATLPSIHRKSSQRLASHTVRRVRESVISIVSTSITVFGAIIVLIPVFWMISTSLKTPSEALAFPPIWIPKVIRWQNYYDALTFMPFGLYFRNTFFICATTEIGALLSSTLVAYAFARLRARGKSVLFILLLSTLMVPYQVTLIPQFILFKLLGWIDTFSPLIVPTFFGSAFNIFLLRQFFTTIPRDMDDAARMDGAGYFHILWQVLVPMAAPALGTIAILHFMFEWNDFLAPLIYLNSNNNYTVQLGLSQFTAQYGATPYQLLMAASLVVLLPCVILFFVAQRYFIQGIVISGIRG